MSSPQQYDILSLRFNQDFSKTLNLQLKIN